MGMLANVLVFSALPFASCASFSQEATSEMSLDVDAALRLRFERWMMEHKRVYDDENEKEKRFQIFKETVAFVEAHNNNKTKSYRVSVNMFVDLTQEEVMQNYARCNSRRAPLGLVKSTFKYANVTNIPTSVDWREHRAFSNVKEQGNCASCWAFSTVAAVEGIMKTARGTTVELFAQQLVDCSPDGGCDGGYVTTALEFIKRLGLSKHSSYPYIAMKGRCNLTIERVASIRGYEQVPIDETALMTAVAHQPVAASIDHVENLSHKTLRFT